MQSVLTIAGFDPSSGAGVTADLMVFAAHGLFGTSCVTSLTVQSTTGVRSAIHTSRFRMIRGSSPSRRLPKVLRSLRRFTRGDAQHNSVRGQYTKGVVGGKEAAGYETGAGFIKLLYDRELPTDLLKALMQARVDEYEATVESRIHPWHKFQETSVVEQFAEILAAPASGFKINNIM